MTPPLRERWNRQGSLASLQPLEADSRAMMQVPTLFYVVSLLGLITGHVDRAQVTLGWVYVGAHAVHAVAYIG